MKLAISDIELMTLNREEYYWTKLGDFYLTRIIRKANELGLQGEKIREIVGVQELIGTSQRHIDFILEDK